MKGFKKGHGDGPSSGLKAMLRRRGLDLIRVTESKDLLLPASAHHRAYYERLKNYSFRLVLRDIIKRQRSFQPTDLTRFCSLPKVHEHLAFLFKLGLIQHRDESYRLVSKPIRSFGDTLEWFVARVFEEEFEGEVLWGIRFKNSAAGGDYDVVASMEGDLVYGEVKSSPPKHIEQKEVRAFLDRINDLLPHVAFFFVDTELRMKDKIVPQFEAELRSRYGIAAAKRYPVARIKNELFGINHQVFIVNSKRDVIANFRDCFRDYWRSRLHI